MTALQRNLGESIMGGLQMEKLVRALLVVTALAMLVSWTVWASEQVAVGEPVAISGSILKDSILPEVWERW